MEADLRDLISLSESDLPQLRFYQWPKGSITHGYFLDPWKYLKRENCKKLLLARRPTGGGLIFHDFDLSFSLIIPAYHPCFSLNTLENYRRINAFIASAIEKFDSNLKPFFHFKDRISKGPVFCMSKSTIYDILIDNRKVCGAAQRRSKKGFLHQGSICLSLPEKGFLKEFLNEEESLLMLQNSFPLLHTYEKKEELKNTLIEKLQEGLASPESLKMMF